MCWPGQLSADCARGDGVLSNEALPIQALKREERLSGRVARQLEDLVVKGALETGQRLPTERELAETFGVSRTVIREAVHGLAARGLLDVRTGSGTFVSGPSTDSVTESLSLLLRFRAEGFFVEHLHEARRVLEAEIAGRAAERARDEDIADLEDILRRMEDAVDDRDASASLDVEFHQALAVATHNPLYIILLDSIGDLLLEIRRLSLQDSGTVPKALYHHRAVLEEVKRRDPELARKAMDVHLDQAEDTMRHVLTTREHAQTLFQSPVAPAPPGQDLT